MKIKAWFEKNDIKLVSKLTFAALIFTFGALYTQATWSDPTAPPSQANVTKPINVGADAQVKGGDLTVQNIGALNAEVSGYVQTGEFDVTDICNADLDGALGYASTCLLFCMDNGDGSYGWVDICPL